MIKFNEQLTSHVINEEERARKAKPAPSPGRARSRLRVTSTCAAATDHHPTARRAAAARQRASAVVGRGIISPRARPSAVPLVAMPAIGLYSASSGRKGAWLAAMLEVRKRPSGSAKALGARVEEAPVRWLVASGSPKGRSGWSKGESCRPTVTNEPRVRCLKIGGFAPAPPAALASALKRPSGEVRRVPAE
ncbi:hypothetical protein T492DRAFT_1004400 [Pavlovales sp. CCMP2436]|nr:hypothetical protein T492DRAFT_1004400 [Pavlovales sp. CCMP2436]